MLALACAMLATASAWGANVPTGRDIKPADVEALVKVARLVLSGQVKEIGDIPDGIVTPALIQKYTDEASITVFRDRAPLVRYSFHGKNLLDDTYGMMLRARMMPGHAFYGVDRADEAGFFIEFVTTRETIKPADWKKRLSTLALGLEGLEIGDTRRAVAETPEKESAKKPAKTAPRKVTEMLMPTLAVVGELDSRDAFIFRLCDKMKLYPSKRPIMPPGSGLWDEKGTKVTVIGTRCFEVMPGSTRAQEMFRVNTVPETPETETLAGMARTAGDHMCARQGADGSFCPSYRPMTGETGREYDMIAQGLAVEAMLDLYERTKTPRYLEAARRGVEYAMNLSRLDTSKKEPRRFVVFAEEAQLGYTALTAANLSRLSELAPTAKVGKLDTARALAEMAQFLMDMQYDDGSFRYSHQYDPKVPTRYEPRPAHPDMAAWALAQMGLRAKNAGWLERGTLGATYLATKREAAQNWTQPPAFTWLARTLHRLYRENGDKRFADYLFRMADALLAEQYMPGSDKGPDVTGAYAANVQQLVTATACKLAVMNEAAALAREMKDARAERYVKSARLASGFLAANRLRPENSFYLPDPDEALGDFRAGIFRSTVTLETDAFAIEALLMLEELRKGETK